MADNTSDKGARIGTFSVNNSQIMQLKCDGEIIPVPKPKAKRDKPRVATTREHPKSSMMCCCALAYMDDAHALLEVNC